MANGASRVSNVLRNFKTGIINQGLSIVYQFASRSVFIYALGMEYLGINGLFGTILGLLSLAELGFGAAMQYTLYKPIAENDIPRLTALISYLRKIYRGVAVFIGGVGLVLLPFLRLIVNLEEPVPHLEVYYLLILANSALSYLFVYRTMITDASQKAYILHNYDSIIRFVTTALQIALLLATHNFIVYLLFQLVSTCAVNAFKAWKSTRLYPFVREKRELDRPTQKELMVNIKSMLIYRIGIVAVTYTDNILISIMVGTIWVGYYSNYAQIFNNLLAFIVVFFNSVSSSLGNYNAKESKAEQYKLFRVLQLASWWLFAFASICLCVLVQDFMAIWGSIVGENFSLDNLTVIAAILNFYLPGSMRDVALFRDTSGMFRDTKFVYLCYAVLNLVLSIIMGHYLGLAGILFASSISRLISVAWFDPLVIMKKYFGRSPRQYFLLYFRYLLAFLAVLALTWLAGGLLQAGTYVSFAYKAAVCAVLPNVLFFLLFGKTNEFTYLKEKLLQKWKERASQ